MNNIQIIFSHKCHVVSTYFHLVKICGMEQPHTYVYAAIQFPICHEKMRNAISLFCRLLNASVVCEGNQHEGFFSKRFQ